ncbi:MAG: hypothetical protein HUJ26_08980 [Planctomycetaceae bacterium]|nr:hypothetical protein [Planctomycetaceae bacterium]
MNNPTSSQPRSDEKSSRLERALWWGWLIAHLVIIWSFTYIPTRDGPAHLASRFIERNYDSPQTNFAEYFTFSRTQVPNLTTVWLLRGLMAVFPPLIAEKVLVSLYVVAMTFAFLYFLRSFGEGARTVSAIGFLLIFNGTFYMGFYNYNFSLALYLTILGFLFRYAERPTGQQWLILSGLLTATYFCHLLGFLMAVASAVFILAVMGHFRFRRLILLIAAALPGLLLTADYLFRTAHAETPAGDQQGILAALAEIRPSFSGVYEDLVLMVTEGYVPYSYDYLPYGTLIVCVYGLILGAAWFQKKRLLSAEIRLKKAQIITLIFGAVSLLAYLIFPDMLGAHGGFLKIRFALNVFIFGAACLCVPLEGELRSVVIYYLHGLVAVHLACVTLFTNAANEEIDVFLSGRDVFSPGDVLYREDSDPATEFQGYLANGTSYYCFMSSIVPLDLYQAEVDHFLIQFQPGYERGRGDFFTYDHRDQVDYVIGWYSQPSEEFEAHSELKSVFQNQKLHIDRVERNAIGN